MKKNKSVKTLNLFRCSSRRGNPTDKEADFFVTDYFDGIKIESLSLDKTSLAECMGIKREVNMEKKGISHQRYCLLDEGENENLFEAMDEFPLMTVIQIFINPNIYQAKHFANKEKISCEICMKRVQACIERIYRYGEKVEWGLYRLLTAGDFAIIVRSKNIHDAYDISTLVRSIRIEGKGIIENESEAFFSYSISGILDKEDQDDKSLNINWEKCLNPKDEIVIRVEYSQSFRGYDQREEIQRMKLDILQSGQHLWGRYDHRVILNPKEFQEVYPYLRKFKFGKADMIIGESYSNDKVSSLIMMLENGYVDQVNEKIFLKYEEDSILTGENTEKWGVILEEGTNWQSLYDKNCQRIEELKQTILWIEENINTFCHSARNIKEYIRLMGRLRRVFNEINELHELRISVANVLKQFEIFLLSFRKYLENKLDEGEKWDKKSVADRIEENLLHGIGALEIFVRYIRNVNLQTLQTPNYDLQTNVCVEKVLLAYSQYLKLFTDNRDKPYYLSNVSYPIVVPNMDKRDLSVCVLFDDDHAEEFDRINKLMVAYSPTFLTLCETCFMMPALFHEIAHHFRYEGRRERNSCIEATVLKGIILNILRNELSELNEYGLVDEQMYEELVNTIYKRMSDRFMSQEKMEKCLQEFRVEMEEVLNQIIDSAYAYSDAPQILVKHYVKKTRANVQKFDKEVQEALSGILHEIERIDEYINNEHVGNKDEMEDGFQLDDLKKALSKYRDILERQLWNEIVECLKDIDQSLYMEKYVMESEKTRDFLIKYSKDGCSGDYMRKGEDLLGLWNGIEENIEKPEQRMKLKSLLKQYHNIIWNYIICEEKLGEKVEIKSKEQQLFIQEMGEIVYEETLKKLKEFELRRKEKLSWDTVAVPSDRIEFIKKRMKIETKEGMVEDIRNNIASMEKKKVADYLYATIEVYREVTSDLFMCGIIGMDMFGYLVVVAENFNFRKDNEFALSKRVFWVLQCLSQKRKQGKLKGEDFDNELVQRVRMEIEKLYEKLPLTKKDKMDWINMELEDMIRLMGELNTEVKGKYLMDLTSTQKWIIRIYWQIVCLTANLLELQMACEAIDEKEMWHDISGEKSYYEQRERLQKLLRENGGADLCQGIAEILNSPAEFFEQRKSLASEEIEFIFKHYEESCRSIWGR